MTDTMGTDTPGADAQGPNWRQMEQKVTAAEARATELESKLANHRSLLVNQAVALAGFKPDAEGKFGGPVPLLIKEFEGVVGDEIPTAAAFAALAAQYGVTPTPSDGQAPTSPLAAQIAAMQQPGDQLRAASGAPQPDVPLDEQIAAAEAAGNWAQSTALKTQKLRQLTA